MHEGGFSVEVDEAGRFVFRTPDGMPLDAAGAPRTAPADVVSRLRAATAARGVAIEPDTGVPDWGGEEMDEELAIFALLRADERGEGRGSRPSYTSRS